MILKFVRAEDVHLVPSHHVSRPSYGVADACGVGWNNCLGSHVVGQATTLLGDKY